MMEKLRKGGIINSLLSEGSYNVDGDLVSLFLYYIL